MTLGAWLRIRRAPSEEPTMNVKDWYDEVARRADTTGIGVGAAETSRVLSEAAKVLAEQPPDKALGVLYGWLKLAADKEC